MMTSNCPACQTPIEHEEFLFEVQCQCGSRFNPFDTPPGGDGETPALDPAPSGGPSENYSESSAVFQELRDFGESLGNVTEGAPSTLAGTSLAAEIPPPSPTPPRKTGASEKPASVFFTSAQILPGYELVNFLAPLSAWGRLEADSPNPLQSAYDALAEQAQALGANAVVEIRWNTLPDGSKVIVSGSAVRLSKTTP